MTPIYIPLDLQINTLLRLPVKSLLRFRCVSKLWSSIITSRDFRKRLLDIASSSAPHRLLIAFADFCGSKLLVVSSPNLNAPSSSSSSYRDLSLVNIDGRVVYNACRGLICVGDFCENLSICNPSTRKLHTCPLIKIKDYRRFGPYPKYILGYDPVEDQYKVLAVDFSLCRLEHKVLTLGGKAWRKAPCVAAYPHNVCTRGLYMNGTVYYGASRKDIEYFPNSNSMIVSFDVRLETFNIIKVPTKVLPMGIDKTTLINYRGKIGVVENPREGSFGMWVVEDAEKEEWSMNTFHLPESVVGLDFEVMDTFSTGEICLVPKQVSDPFCLFYYNLKRNSMRSVIIERLPISKLSEPVAFL